MMGALARSRWRVRARTFAPTSMFGGGGGGSGAAAAAPEGDEEEEEEGEEEVGNWTSCRRARRRVERW